MTPVNDAMCGNMSNNLSSREDNVIGCVSPSVSSLAFEPTDVCMFMGHDHSSSGLKVKVVDQGQE